MNFKFKTLVAAVLLATTASSASAAIDGASTEGGTELVFNAWDDVAGVGYTYDLVSALNLVSFLGVDTSTNSTNNAAQLFAATNIDSSIITGPNGTIFDGVLTGFNFTDVSNVQWNLSAADNIGRRRNIITKDSLSADPIAGRNDRIAGFGTAINGQFSQSNALAANQGRGEIEDTFNTSVLADGAGYAGSLGNTGPSGSTFWDNTNQMGGQSFLYMMAQSSTSPSAGAQQGLFARLAIAGGQDIVVSTYQQGTEWRLNIAANIAAIPEPETYAMFLAGLGMMGAVARRRKGQVK